MMMILRNFLLLLKPSVRVAIKCGEKVIVRNTLMCDLTWIVVSEYQDYNVSSYEVIDGVLWFNLAAPGYRRQW